MLFDEEQTRRRLWNWCMRHSNGQVAEAYVFSRDDLPLAGVMQWAEFIEMITPEIKVSTELLEAAAKYISLPIYGAQEKARIMGRVEALTGQAAAEYLAGTGAYAFPDALYEIDE